MSYAVPNSKPGDQYNEEEELLLQTESAGCQVAEDVGIQSSIRDEVKSQEKLAESVQSHVFFTRVDEASVAVGSPPDDSKGGSPTAGQAVAMTDEQTSEEASSRTGGEHSGVQGEAENVANQEASSTGHGMISGTSVEAESTQGNTAEKSSSPLPIPTRQFPKEGDPKNRIPDTRADMVGKPFVYEFFILRLTCEQRISAVKDAMDAGEHINPSMFGYLFLNPACLNEVLEGFNLMKKHWMSRRHTSKEPDYIIASRLLIPLLVKYNHNDLLLNALENRMDYGLVRGQHFLIDAIRQWNLCGRIDLLERIIQILMKNGEKITSTIISTIAEAYLNAGLFQKADELIKLSKSKSWRVPLETLHQVERVMSGKQSWIVRRTYTCKLREDGSVWVGNRRPGKFKSYPKNDVKKSK